MAKKSKKKNTITIVLLLLLVVAMGAAYFLLVNKDDSDDTSDTDTETEDTSVELSAYETDQVSSLTFDNGTLAMTLLYDGENWTDEADPDFPVYKAKANTMVKAVANLTATQQVTDAPEDIAEYGLDNPALTVQIGLNDGTSFGLKLGDKLVTDEGYYAMAEGDPAVYVVAKSVYNSFNIELSDLTQQEETPSFTTDQILALKIESEEYGNFEILYDTENEYDYSENGMYPWTIFQPYKVPVSGDSTNITTLLENYTSFSFSECVNYNAQDLSVYGLEEPSAVLTMTYIPETEETEESEEETEDAAEEVEVDPEVYTLYFGDVNESGYCYVRQNDSNAVYTMSQSNVETLLEVDAFAQVNILPALLYITACDSIEIELEGEKYEAVIEHITVTDEDGEEEEEEVFYFQGIEATDETAFRTFYQQLIGFTIETELPEDWSDEGLNPFLTMVFHKNTGKYREVTIEFLPYNDNFYAVRVNGTATFAADARDINSLKEVIRTYNPAEAEEE